MRRSSSSHSLALKLHWRRYPWRRCWARSRQLPAARTSPKVSPRMPTAQASGSGPRRRNPRRPHGRTGHGILRCAEEIKPLGIILCKHTAPAPREVLGSTAASVLGNASDPLVLVPPERGATPWRVQHVLVPHDGTPRNSVGLRPAVEIAERAGAELLLLHVADPGAAPGERGSLIPPLYMDHPQHEWPAWTSAFVRRFASLCLLGQVHVLFRLAFGNPAAEVLRVAKEQSADLLLLAWRGVLDEPRAAILNTLVAEARCPVMVLRARCVLKLGYGDEDGAPEDGSGASGGATSTQRSPAGTTHAAIREPGTGGVARDRTHPLCRPILLRLWHEKRKN